MLKNSIKTRFAPSPTGLIHLGNCRTALLNALYAMHEKGVFLLRIEDTDVERSSNSYVNSLITDLRWLHMHWQEGAEAISSEGDVGPYFQSQRNEIYSKYYKQLIDSGRAYSCFCSETELALTRKLQLSAGKPPRYSNICYRLSIEQVQEKITAGLKPTLRFHLLDDEVIIFQDIVKGYQRYQANDIGDFIIRRTDGSPTFMFCNAIDDALMNVTHVMRGEDHLTNTPRQIAILQALNLRVPKYAHISLILGQDGTPLSKRNGSRSIHELRDMGYLPIAVVNYLARLGHYYESPKFMSYEELANHFSLKHLIHSPARFDEQQFRYFQKEAMERISLESLWKLMPSEVHQLIPENKKEFFINLVKPNILFPKEALFWAKVLTAEELSYDENARILLAETSTNFFEITLEALKQGKDFSQIIESLKQKENVKGKALFEPLRIALTGESHGPELLGVANFLGSEKLRQRIKKAMTKK